MRCRSKQLRVIWFGARPTRAATVRGRLIYGGHGGGVAAAVNNSFLQFSITSVGARLQQHCSRPQCSSGRGGRCTVNAKGGAAARSARNDKPCQETNTTRHRGSNNVGFSAGNRTVAASGRVLDGGELPRDSAAIYVSYMGCCASKCRFAMLRMARYIVARGGYAHAFRASASAHAR